MNTALKRIKDKLSLAKDVDVELEVLGADHHYYQIGPAASCELIEAFEGQYQIEIPLAYKMFLTQIGYGNVHKDAYKKGGAGPFYGILPLDRALEELDCEEPQKYLSYPCQLFPNMTQLQWQDLSKEVLVSECELSEKEYEKAVGTLYGGLLPLATQGCGITTALVLNGPYAGRIVYLDWQFAPFFTFEKDFIQWYERWLDEVISTELIANTDAVFALRKAGTQQELWQEFLESTQDTDRIDCLWGLCEKTQLSKQVVDQVINAIPTVSEKVAFELLRLASKFNYPEVKELSMLFAENNLLHVLQNVCWYAKEYAVDWVDFICARIEKIDHIPTLSVCIDVLLNTKVDVIQVILPKFSHEKSCVRSVAYSTLAQVDNKQQYIELFKQGLKDEDADVVLSTLYGVVNIEDLSLLPYYQELQLRFDFSTHQAIGMHVRHAMRLVDKA